MRQEEIVKRVDKAIEELIAIKVALTEAKQEEAFPDIKMVDIAKEEAIQVIEYLSARRIKYKLSKRPLLQNTQRINMVKSRIKESSREDAMAMITTRFMVWGNDEKFKQYLTIETMFRPSKYHKYVDEIEAINKTVPKEFTQVESTTKRGTWTD